jgi:hypothetical protein
VVRQGKPLPITPTIKIKKTATGAPDPYGLLLVCLYTACAIFGIHTISP